MAHRAACAITVLLSACRAEAPPVEKFACGPEDCGLSIRLVDAQETDSVLITPGEQVCAPPQEMCEYVFAPGTEVTLQTRGRPAWFDGTESPWTFMADEVRFTNAQFFDDPPCASVCTVPCVDDGCGNLCECPRLAAVCVRGECCIPNCGFDECGVDPNCGISCGTCEGGEVCEGGRCSRCEGSCEGKDCGDDGCGRPCGTCADPGVCSAAGICEFAVDLNPVGPHVMMIVDDSASMGFDVYAIAGSCPYDRANHPLPIDLQPPDGQMLRFEGLRSAMAGCEAGDDGWLDQPLPFNLGFVSQGGAPARIDIGIGTPAVGLEAALSRATTSGGSAVDESLILAVRRLQSQITDATSDAGASAAIILVTDNENNGPPPQGVVACDGTPLPVPAGRMNTAQLAEHLQSGDMLCDLTGDQPITLHVLAVDTATSAHPFLSAAATAGGGRFYTATTAADIRTALEDLLTAF